jgi:hypothetical protein
VERKLRAYLPAGSFGRESVARSAATSEVVRVLAHRKPAEAEPARQSEPVVTPSGTEQIKKEPTTLEWINSLVAADLLNSELKTLDGKPIVREDGKDRPAPRGRRAAVEEAA